MIEVEDLIYFLSKRSRDEEETCACIADLGHNGQKIFSLPEVTAAFIQDILELGVADAQIVEKPGLQHGP